MAGQKTFTPSAIYVTGAGLIGKNAAGQAELLSAGDVLTLIGALPLTGGTATGNINITSGDNYRAMLITKGNVSNQAAITFTNGSGDYATIGMSDGRFVITRSEYVSNDQLLQFSTAGHGESIHASDSTNLYGTGDINVEVAPSVAYPAIHALMRGSPTAAEKAFIVTSGPSYNTEKYCVDFAGNVTCTSVTSNMASGSSNPTTSDIASGYGKWWKNTSNGEIRYWVNNGGTMNKSAALTT